MLSAIITTLQVSMAPSCVDVFGEEQLIERLASLVANHLTTPRWLFKLPHHIRGSGFGTPTLLLCRWSFVCFLYM